MKTLALVCLAIVTYSIAWGQSNVAVRKAKLKELNFLIGEWDIKSTGRNIIGDSILQSGRVSFSYDMDSTVIRNEREFHTTKASGAYRSWEIDSEFYEYILFSPTRNMYEFIAFEYGSASAARYWLVDKQKKLIRYTFAYFDTSSKLTIEMIVTLKAISDRELIETFEGIAFENGERQTINTLRYARAK